MAQFTLTCCSTADLPPKHFESRNIPYVCFHFTLDGKEYLDDLGQTVPFEVFYGKIAEGSMPTTSQVNVQEFINFFTPFLEQGQDILHVSLSSGLSGAYNSAVTAAEELAKDFPDRKILVVDSLGASSGYGLLMENVADLRDAGKSIDECYQWLMDNRLRMHHWFFSTDLSHYKRGGRISASAAVIGSLLNICPLMDMDNNGYLTPRTKLRGKKNVIKAIEQKMEEHAEGGKEYSGKCFMSQAGCYEDARAVADIIEANFPNLDGKVMINSVGTVIGSHTGPGTVALFFLGDERVN